MPKNKPPAAGKKVKKVLKRLRRPTPHFNNNYGNYGYGNGNCSYAGNFGNGQPFDPNLPPGGILYFQPVNVDTASSSITIINNTITAGGAQQQYPNPVWPSSESQVWQQYNQQQYYQDPNNDTCMPFEWQLPPQNNVWEDQSPEAIANPEQVNKEPKKSLKGPKQIDNRIKSQDDAIHSSVFASQTENPPSVPRRHDSTKTQASNSSSVNPFKTVESPSEDTLFQDMLKQTFRLENHLKAYNQLVESPLSVQIDKLVESQQLSNEQLRIRWQLAFDLLYLLRYHYPTCEVYGIDSVLTHFKKDLSLSSDVQLYVDVTGSGLTYENTSTSASGLQNIIQQVKSILGAHRCPHQRSRSFVDMFIKKEKNKFIQFIHGPSQLTCQLNFQSQLPAKRSQLIRYCIKSDPRILKFNGALRYWGQYYGICDGKNGSNKISEYALFLLGLVYLIENKKMQPVENLPPDLLKPPSLRKDSLGDSYVPEKNLGEAVLQYMKGFCEKYANLDFKTVAVLPLTGKIIPRHEFISSNQGKVAGKFGDAALCIDPLDCKINVFQGEQAPVALQFFHLACKKTLKFLEETGGHQDEKSILDLFIARHNSSQILNLKMANDFPVVYITKLASEDKILDSFSTIQKMELMRKKMYDLWKDFAKEFILDIFPTGFKLPPVVVDEKSPCGNSSGAQSVKKLYRVSYPFWERIGNSELLLKEENNQSQDPIQVEKIKSTAILVSYLARKGKQSEEFQEFWIQVEYKFTVNGEGIQEMQVRLLKIPVGKNLPEQDSECNDNANVIQAVFRIMERVFQPYLIYRLNNASAIGTN